MNTRENSIATWCKGFRSIWWNLHDRMKAGQLIVYEKRGEDEINVTPSAINKIKELISGIERALLDLPIMEPPPRHMPICCITEHYAGHTGPSS